MRLGFALLLFIHLFSVPFRLYNLSVFGIMKAEGTNNCC